MTTTETGVRTAFTTAAASNSASGGAAARLATALHPFVGRELPVRLRAWDGSEAGPVHAPLVELCSRDALRRLLWHPNELGAGTC